MTGLAHRPGGPPDRRGPRDPFLDDRDTVPLGAVRDDRPGPGRPPFGPAAPGRSDPGRPDADRLDPGRPDPVRREPGPRDQDRHEDDRVTPERVGPPGGGGGRAGRGRGRVLLAGLLVVVLLGAGYGIWSLVGAPDYDGPGAGDVIVQVRSGDSTRAIAAELETADVVRSARAFTRAASDDEDRARAVQPGYYRLRLRMSGAAAVALLLDASSRVGQLEIKGGVQLDDTRGPNGSVAPGVLSLISRSTCTQLNGASTCVSTEALRRTMASLPPEQLGVPGWALDEVGRADPGRRLEGLIAPGRYDVRPGSSAPEVLRELVSSSAVQYEALGITSPARADRYSPYQLLVIASLVEKEGITQDFGKVARVLYNRLDERVRLELDSTVNYPLDLQAARTSDADRGRSGAYNSYRTYGLPPTPIGAPGRGAVQAALRPEPGPWMFFVKCQRDGTSCFATTLPEHQRNVRLGLSNGAF